MCVCVAIESKYMDASSHRSAAHPVLYCRTCAQEQNWLLGTESWWDEWWDVIRQIHGQIQHFLALHSHEKLGEHYRYFMEAVAPCLTQFFELCCESKLSECLNSGCLVEAKAMGTDLIAVANSCVNPTREQVQAMEAFWEILTRSLREMDEELVCVCL